MHDCVLSASKHILEVDFSATGISISHIHKLLPFTLKVQQEAARVKVRIAFGSHAHYVCFNLWHRDQTLEHGVFFHDHNLGHMSELTHWKSFWRAPLRWDLQVVYIEFG
jgi:hypothetical protein